MLTCEHCGKGIGSDRKCDCQSGRYADLIERLEKATEGSRKLDALIWAVTNPDAYAEGFVSLNTVPRFTESLDRALTLVPEGWYGRVWFSALPPHIAHNNNRASIWSPDPEQEHAFFGPSGNAATAPLALCIAALKARQAAP